MWTNLKQAIDSVITSNDNQEITGAVLNNALKTIVDTVGANASYAGIATPSTNPGTPDGPVFYFALQGGTYTNFGATVIQEGLAILLWDGTSWSSESAFNKEAICEVYDISAAHNNATYANLAAALGTDGANIPQSLQKGGMSVKFVLTSDNKYVQYRLMSETFNTTVANWQGVDDRPTAGSNNSVKSGGVFDETHMDADISNDYANILDNTVLFAQGQTVSSNNLAVRVYSVKAGNTYHIDSGFVGGFPVGALYSDMACTTLIELLPIYEGTAADESTYNGYYTPSQDGYLGINHKSLSVYDNPDYDDIYLNLNGPVLIKKALKDLDDKVKDLDDKVEDLTEDVENISHFDYDVTEILANRIDGKYINSAGGVADLSPFSILVYKVLEGHKYHIVSGFVGGNLVGALYSDVDCATLVSLLPFYEGTQAEEKTYDGYYTPSQDGYIGLNYKSILYENDLGMAYIYVNLYESKETHKGAFDLSREVTKLKDVTGSDDIICIGDSLTQGSQWIDELKSNMEEYVNIVNHSSGGNSTLEMASLIGAYPIDVEPVTIPASGGVTLQISSPVSQDIYGAERGFYPGRQGDIGFVNPYTLGGIEGNIVHTGDGSGSSTNHTYTFTRCVNGSALSLTRQEEMMPSNYNDLDQRIKIVWLGTNDTPQDIGVDKWLMMLDAVIGNSKRFIVIGMTAKVIMSDIASINQAAFNKYGSHFLDIRDYLLKYGLQDAGITPTAQDEQDLAEGEIPSSLRIDIVHFNSYGYQIVGQQVYKLGKKLNYWK